MNRFRTIKSCHPPSYTYSITLEVTKAVKEAHRRQKGQQRGLDNLKKFLTIFLDRVLSGQKTKGSHLNLLGAYKALIYLN